MFRVEIHDNSYEYFSNIDLSENALHITSNLSLSKLILESNKDIKNHIKILSIESLLTDIYPKLNNPLNRTKLKIELRNILVSNDIENTFLQEDNFNILFSDFLFLIESGIRFIPDIEAITKKQEALKIIFNKFVESDRVKEVIKEISSSSNLKFKYNLKGNEKIEKIYLYNFNSLYLSRMVFFNRLKYLGYELIFRIPFMNIKNIDEPWINLYSKEYFQWDINGYKKYTNNVNNAFIDYLDGKTVENIETNIEFKQFIGSYEFKRELEACKDKKISYYGLDNSLLNQVFDINDTEEYYTPIIRFMDKMYNCEYKNNNIYLNYDIIVDLLTSGWIEIKEGNRNINGIYYLDFFKKIESYFYDIESIEGFLERLEDLRNLKLSSDTMENQVKDKIGKSKVKLFLSNPLRCISSVNIDDFDMTILQLKSLVERLRYILKTTIKREDGFINYNKNCEFLKSILDRNAYISNLQEDDRYKNIKIKIYKVLNYKVDFEFIHKEDIKELIYILSNKENNHDKILPLDVIDGNWQRRVDAKNKFNKIHITDLSFKAYKKYLDKKQIDSKYVNYEFIDSILLTDNYKNKKELKECLEISKASSNNIERFLTFDIANLIANYEGKIVLSYIENLRDGDSESILLRILKNLYKKDNPKDDILLDYLDDIELDSYENTELLEAPTNEMLNKFRYISPIGFRDLDFCYYKFINSSLINSHIVYDNDFHQRLVFIELICLLRGDIPNSENNIKKFIFPLFPQWNYTTKENMLLTSYFNLPLQEYNLYENINYPKNMARLEVLMSKYNEGYRIKNRYNENKLDTEKEFKEFLKVYSKEEKIVNPGKHCSMCPYILICKEGEYPIERNN